MSEAPTKSKQADQSKKAEIAKKAAEERAAAIKAKKEEQAKKAAALKAAAAERATAAKAKKEELAKNAQLKKPKAPPKRAPPPKKAPKGVPSIARWKKNRDGSITGFISGSPNFTEGERITTSPIVKGSLNAGEVVQTGSGSKYFLV